MDYLTINDRIIPCKLALTAEEQINGLMWEKEPQIMAFPYKNPAIRKFWMRNTVQPLDLLFCKAGVIKSIYRGSPFSLQTIGPDEPSDLVVEMPFLQTEAWKIQTNQSIKLSFSLRNVARLYEDNLRNRRKYC